MGTTTMTAYAGGALQLSLEAPIAVLTLNRPEARNAFNTAMWRAIPDIVDQVAKDPAIRVLMLRGAGGNFASGADITEFDQVFADRASALAYGRLIEAATAALAGLDRPVIAWIEGYCIGAGLAVALSCDLRLAEDGARFGAPPAKLGLIYSLTDTRRLVQAVGASAAKGMLFTGQLYAAGDALRLGLVDEVHGREALEPAVSAKAALIAGLSSGSIRSAKALVAMILAGQWEETDQTRGWFADAAQSDDFAEGLAAFHAKRPPIFR
jgi:enoyl-CoA hydratase/carnithine racemase